MNNDVIAVDQDSAGHPGQADLVVRQQVRDRQQATVQRRLRGGGINNNTFRADHQHDGVGDRRRGVIQLQPQGPVVQIEPHDHRRDQCFRSGTRNCDLPGEQGRPHTARGRHASGVGSELGHRDERLGARSGQDAQQRRPSRRRRPNPDPQRHHVRQGSRHARGQRLQYDSPASTRVRGQRRGRRDCGSTGSVVFRVFADSTKIVDSGTMTGATARQTHRGQRHCEEPAPARRHRRRVTTTTPITPTGRRR